MAVGTCALITPYLFFISRSADGTRLKLALLEMKNKYSIIKAQIPTAVRCCGQHRADVLPGLPLNGIPNCKETHGRHHFPPHCPNGRAWPAAYADIVLENLSGPTPSPPRAWRSPSQTAQPEGTFLHPAFHTSFDWHCLRPHDLGWAFPCWSTGSRARRAPPCDRAGRQPDRDNLAVEGAYLRGQPQLGTALRLGVARAPRRTAATSNDAQRYGGGVQVVPEPAGRCAWRPWSTGLDRQSRVPRDPPGLHTNAAFGSGHDAGCLPCLGPDDAASLKCCRRRPFELVPGRRRLARRLGNERPGLPVRRPERSGPHGPGARG